MSTDLAITIVLGIMSIICTIIWSNKSKETKKGRCAKYLTIVRREVSCSTTRDTFADDKAICNRFLLLCITRNDSHYLDGIIKDNSIGDSKEFIYYICEVAEENPKDHEYLIR